MEVKMPTNAVIPKAIINKVNNDLNKLALMFCNASVIISVNFIIKIQIYYENFNPCHKRIYFTSSECTENQLVRI